MVRVRSWLFATVIPLCFWFPSTHAQERPGLQLQIAGSKAFQVESAGDVRRAEAFNVVWPKGQFGPTIRAFILLTNVAADGCDVRLPPVQSDADFVIRAVLTEGFDQKNGPQDTAISQTLRPAPKAGAPWLFVVAKLDYKKLDPIVGDAAYSAVEAWHVGGGNRAGAMMLKGAPPINVRLGNSEGDWDVNVNHVSAKDKTVETHLNQDSRLVFRRDGSGPRIQLKYKDKRVAFSADLPLTTCPPLPDQGPLPFGVVRR